MTCKDNCLCNEVCANYDLFKPEECSHFKDKSRFVELPCKVGDTFYILAQSSIKGELSNKYFIDERQVSCFEYDEKITIYDYDGMDFSIDNIFFDKSKAEAKLKELNEK